MATQTRKPLKERARHRWEELRKPYSCNCGCGRRFKTPREMNAYYLGHHAQRWMSKKAKAAGRAMGKDMDKARRHARGWLESAGLRDEQNRKTAKAKARPELSGRIKIRDLRAAHKHDRAHDRTQKVAGRSDRRAAKADARGKGDWRDIHSSRAARIRERHGKAWPERKPAARPAPARPAPSNGRTQSANGQLPGRTARKTPARTGRSGR